MMSRRFFKLSLACLLVAALPAGNVSGMTNLISGDVANSVTWSETNLLQGTVVVRSNVVLTIEPGTRLLMGGGATLLVYGQLLANGTSNQPIYFTRATASTSWERIKFVGAADSRLGQCVIEYANSAGNHQDYYDNDCNTNTPPLPRNYHEAVVALASHLDIEGCIFRNLPSNTSSAEGDAIAIIADDPQQPRSSTASSGIAPRRSNWPTARSPRIAVPTRRSFTATSKAVRPPPRSLRNRPSFGEAATSMPILNSPAPARTITACVPLLPALMRARTSVSSPPISASA